MKYSLKLLLTCLLLIGLGPTVGAQAPNFVYSFYDGPDGTGNLMATYTGPLITSTSGGTTSGFTLNPGAIQQWARVYGAPFLQITATSIQPCRILTWTYGSDGTTTSPPVNTSILCVLDVTDSSGNVLQSVALRANLDALYPGPGTYNVPVLSGPNPWPVIGVFEDESVSPDYYAISQNIASTVISPVEPTYTCTGFQSPFSVAIALTSKTNRAIPLKAQLFNGSTIVDSSILTTPPVVNVSFSSIDGTGTDDTSLLDPLGQSSNGNQFNYDSTSETWWFNLASTPFTSNGTYTVTMQPGDATKYLLLPTCSGTFVRK